MFLLEYTSLGVLVTEDEVNLEEMKCEYWPEKVTRRFHLGSRTRQIRTEHDDPWRSVGELLSTRLETILQKLEVTTTAITTLLVFDLVLDHERFLLKVYRLGERCRDCMVSSLAFCNQADVTLNDLNQRFFNFPFTDITKCFAADWGLFGSL